MSIYLDTSGNSSLGIALCGRCAKKFPIGELYSDPNNPSLMVCRNDLDELDPYRLAPRTSDIIALAFTRPDMGIETSPSGLMSEDEDMFITTEDGEGYLIP